MGDKSIKNTQVKKKKKVVDEKQSSPATYENLVYSQPELITKKKKEKENQKQNHWKAPMVLVVSFLLFNIYS